MKSKVLTVLENIAGEGRTGNPEIDSLFGPYYGSQEPPEIIKGWDFRPAAVDQAFDHGVMYHADIDTPNRRCILNCEYCFVRGDSRFGGLTLLSVDEWTRAMQGLKGEGVESVKIVGMAETTHDPRYFLFLEILQELGITPVVFSAGYVYGDNQWASKVHGMSGEEMIQKTLDLGASIMVKFDSLRSDVQDKIVRVDGYSHKRDEAIRRFLEIGNLGYGAASRFGLEVNLGEHNVDDIFAVYALRKLAGIYVDICLSMDCGALGAIQTRDAISGLSNEQVAEVIAGILFMNQTLDIRDDGVSPYIGVMRCSQVSLPSLYINGGGNIYFACCGNTKRLLGNARETSIQDAREQAIKISQEYALPRLHGCPFREEAGIIPLDLEQNVTIRLDEYAATG